MAAFGKIKATAERPTHTNTESRCQITSARLPPKRFRHAVRFRNAIECCLHRVPDVTMNRDQQRSRKGNRQEDLPMTQRFAFDPARLEPIKDLMRGKTKCASWNDDFLLRINRAAKPEPQKR